MQVVRVLNRLVEWTAAGIHYAAYQRRADTSCVQLGHTGSTQGVVTPGVDTAYNTEGERLLTPAHSTPYRALVARTILLAQDMLAIHVALTEVYRELSRPTERGCI